MEESLSLPFFVMASCQTQRESLGISLKEKKVISDEWTLEDVND